jgi:hypothetical protein
MTRCTFLSALMAVLLIPALTYAEATPENAVVVADESAAAEVDGSDVSEAPAAMDASGEIGWDQFDDPGFDPAVEPQMANDSGASARAGLDEPSDEEILGSVPVDENGRPQIRLEAHSDSAPMRSSGVLLGPLGIDDLGRAGRLHTVARGDTLWDLSAAYLGTPWVWPSVWIDNDDIDNPHLILPGNKIWITANEMRVVTDAEAESYLSSMAESGAQADTDLDSMSGLEDTVPVAALDGSLEMSGEGMDEPSTLEAFPVAIASAPVQSAARGRRVTVSRRESMGFVSAEDLAGASSIVGSPHERTFLASGDEVILGMGEGDVEIGDRFSVFIAIEEVRDPETLRLLGHHVDPLGWVEVKELTGDTSIAEIRTSYSEIRRGARVIPRDPPPTSVELRTTPDVIEGMVVFLPSERALMADGGYVYLNRGEFHGVEVGSELEVFDPGAIVEERARRVDVRTPDQTVARLVVVSVEPDSAVGFVLWSKRELIVGDTVRAMVPKLAQR